MTKAFWGSIPFLELLSALHPILVDGADAVALFDPAAVVPLHLAAETSLILLVKAIPEYIIFLLQANQHVSSISATQ